VGGLNIEAARAFLFHHDCPFQLTFVYWIFNLILSDLIFRTEGVKLSIKAITEVVTEGGHG